MSGLSVFNFDEYSAVRIVMIDNEPWFVLTDVLIALKSTTKLGDVKDSLYKVFEGWGVSNHPIEDSLGRTRDTSIVNEAAVTYIIAHSRTELAHKMNKWLHAEVIPTLRKTGTYSIEPPKQLSATELLIASQQQLMVEVERRQMLSSEGCKSMYTLLRKHSKRSLVRMELSHILNHMAINPYQKYLYAIELNGKQGRDRIGGVQTLNTGWNRESPRATSPYQTNTNPASQKVSKADTKENRSTPAGTYFERDLLLIQSQINFTTAKTNARRRLSGS